MHHNILRALHNKDKQKHKKGDKQKKKINCPDDGLMPALV